MSRGKTVQDPELQALNEIVAVMEKKVDGPDARSRVIEYLSDRFTPVPLPPAGPNPETPE